MSKSVTQVDRNQRVSRASVVITKREKKDPKNEILRFSCNERATRLSSRFGLTNFIPCGISHPFSTTTLIFIECQPQISFHTLTVNHTNNWHHYRARNCGFQKPTKHLQKIYSWIPIPKMILSRATSRHAKTAMRRLAGTSRCFGVLSTANSSPLVRNGAFR